MSKSSIEWTEHTANPIIGCSKCSPACDNCYALTMARRFTGMKGPVGDDYRRVVTDGEWNGKTVFIPSVLDKIIKRKKPTTYFIGSMTDIFHKNVPFGWVDKIMATIAMCPQHRFMILTKRRDRLKEYHSFPNRAAKIMTVLDMWYEDDPAHDELAVSAAAKIGYEGEFLLKNLALGVSVWDQESADHAIPLLLQTPAARRFVSAEPLLGPIDLSAWVKCPQCKGAGGFLGDKLGFCSCPTCDGGDYSQIDLVIVGGETGHGSRSMPQHWVRSLRDQCLAAGVPFMFKRWGRLHSDGASFGAGFDYSKKNGGRLLDGVEHNGAIQWEAKC